jgi:hypothetical protein
MTRLQMSVRFGAVSLMALAIPPRTSSVWDRPAGVPAAIQTPRTIIRNVCVSANARPVFSGERYSSFHFRVVRSVRLQPDFRRSA